MVDQATQLPLLVAGGGGGTRFDAIQNGCDASVSSFGIVGSGFSTTSSCAVKTNQEGLGGIVSSGSWGSAGGGFNGDGADDSTRGDGGYSWANGARGGECHIGPAHGGFGSGGSGCGNSGGGGGGGYSGGDGGLVAGGGGSFADAAVSSPVLV